MTNHKINNYEYKCFDSYCIIHFSKPSERRGSDVSIRSTSSEVLCNSLYENNAGYSTDSLASNWSLEGSVKSEPPGGEEMVEDNSQDIDGVFDTLIYIGMRDKTISEMINIS